MYMAIRPSAETLQTAPMKNKKHELIMNVQSEDLENEAGLSPTMRALQDSSSKDNGDSSGAKRVELGSAALSDSRGSSSAVGAIRRA